MKINFFKIIIVLIFSSILNNARCEIVTVALLGSSIVAGGWFGWDSIKTQTVCRFKECCNKHYVPYDINKLKNSISQKIFGQPLVTELLSILSAHGEAVYDENKKSKKALVISLHGWSGVGKNYVANLIAESLYLKGMESKYVKLFIGKNDFDCSDLKATQNQLINKVKEIVKECPTSLIIFDEIHEMCHSIIDAIKPMLDHHHNVDGIDFRDSIFIFISNIGSNEIANKLLELYSEGVKRNEIEFHYFEPIIRRSAYNTGGFEKSAAIAQHLIDHYIPFLPLEQQHVEMCVLAEFRAHNILNPSEEMISEALSVITYGPTEDQPIFANNGCKRFTKQIPYVINKHKLKSEL